MTKKIEPVSGLSYGWDTGESGMKQDLDKNAIIIGALMQIRVKSRSVTAPPSSPSDGDAYIPAAGSTGSWTAHVGRYVVFMADTNTWEVFTPKDGWLAVILDEGTWGKLSVRKGGVWSPGLALA